MLSMFGNNSPWTPFFSLAIKIHELASASSSGSHGASLIKTPKATTSF